MKVGKINSVINISTSLKDGFFRYWLIFLKPFHRLTDKEISIFAAILKHRYELSKSVSDEVLLDKITLNEDTKKAVMEELGISKAYIQTLISKLKKLRIVKEGRINPRFIPRVIPDSQGYKLLLMFTFNDEQG